LRKKTLTEAAGTRTRFRVHSPENGGTGHKKNKKGQWERPPHTGRKGRTGGGGKKWGGKSREENVGTGKRNLE